MDRTDVPGNETGFVPGLLTTRAKDIAVAVSVVVTVVALVTAEALVGKGPTFGGTLPLVTGLAVALLAGGRWPRAALLVSVGSVIAFRAAGLSDTGWIWPASAAYFLVAAGSRSSRDRGRAGAGRTAAGPAFAVAVGLLQVAFAANWELFVAGTAGREAVAELGAESLWLALVLAAATACRNWVGWRGEVAAGLERAARERELEGRRRAEAERLQIARELHDVVAHTLTVVGVQLRVAVEALEDEPVEARAALETAQEVRATAVADLRSLLGVLRDPGERGTGGPAMELAPERGLDGVGELVARVRAAGLAADVETAGDPAAVPAPVALAVYRIVQESLTNAVRHSGGTRVAVRLGYGAEQVSVEVVDDGPGEAGDGGEAAGGSGHGVDGMRERVSVLGGEFAAGPEKEGGYAVRALIPVPGWRS
ncbi:sensor histidine kinase [Streptomyces sp. NWU339]|uniref:sensor histidine kinase n=1 Tax=Streptomyces sp. NWU339 TaxID=2185284 RepID=UPI00215B6D4A|nr:histidine kinase [Streptomyces sp. NWU339]